MVLCAKVAAVARRALTSALLLEWAAVLHRKLPAHTGDVRKYPENTVKHTRRYDDDGTEREGAGHNNADEGRRKHTLVGDTGQNERGTVTWQQ